MSEKALFSSSFAKPFIGSTAYRLSAIRRFPFLAAKHSPSYRQRKRSLGFARDDDTGRMRFPHTLSLHDARDIHSLHCHFERSEKSFSSPFSHDSFVKSFRGSTVPAFPAIRCFPFLAVGHAPSYRQRKRSLGSARDDVAEVAFSQHTLYTGRGLSIPPIPSFRAQSRNLPCTLLFLAPFAKGFPFSALSCSLRRSIPVFCYHTYGAMLVCKKDRGLRSG